LKFKGLGFDSGFSLVCLIQAYCSPLHTRHALLSQNRRRTSKFSNIKVHRQTYSHCHKINPALRFTFTFR